MVFLFLDYRCRMISENSGDYFRSTLLATRARENNHQNSSYIVRSALIRSSIGGCVENHPEICSPRLRNGLSKKRCAVA